MEVLDLQNIGRRHFDTHHNWENIMLWDEIIIQAIHFIEYEKSFGALNMNSDVEIFLLPQYLSKKQRVAFEILFHHFVALQQIPVISVPFYLFFCI